MLRKIPATITVTVFAAFLGAVSFIIILYVYGLLNGVFIENRYVCEPRPQQWVIDPEIGYRNKPHYRQHAFGGIKGIADGNGFRAEKPVAQVPENGVIRIVGVGDSVMEGSRLNAEDTFLRMLEGIVRKDGGRVETINAGVCGYSTYEERLFLERVIVPFRPDIVVVNFCSNDFMTTEDPFKKARGIYLRYLRRLTREGRYQFSRQELTAAAAIAAALRKAPHVWDAFEAMRRDPAVEETLERIFIRIPMIEMKEIAGRNDIRLVYLFIEQGNERLKAFLRSAGADVVDCSDLLPGAPPPGPPPAVPSAYSSSFLGRLDPVNTFRRVAELNALRHAQTHRFWLDDVHPSRKGNLVIAGAIYDYLKQAGILQKSSFSPRNSRHLP